MKRKQIFIFMIITSLLLLLTSCISFQFHETDYHKREEQILKIDEKLSESYYKLLENPIQESKRESLEKKYELFYKNLNDLQVKNNPKHLEFLEHYRKKARVQLNYLHDLKVEE